MSQTKPGKPKRGRRVPSRLPIGPLPRYIWADFDPGYLASRRWAFYRSLSEQRANRPDLIPIKINVSLCL